MPSDEKLKKQLKDYVLKEYNKGFTYQQIQKFLVGKGYSQQFVSEVMNEITASPKKSMAWIYVGISILVVIIVVLLIFFVPYMIGVKECSDNECFITEANQCNPAFLVVDDEGTVYEYKSFTDCTLTKSITKVSDAEPFMIKELFTEKSMTCSYDKGAFDEKWLTTLLGGLDQCTGQLKEALYELTIAQYQAEFEE